MMTGLNSASNALTAGLTTARKLALLADKVAVDHQADAHQDAGNNAADVQVGNADARQNAVDQQGDRRRDDRAD